jgi:hypothetical protein
MTRRYCIELKARLRSYGLSVADVATELGKGEGELKRWIDSSACPDKHTVLEIETAIIAIVARRYRATLN